METSKKQTQAGTAWKEKHGKQTHRGRPPAGLHNCMNVMDLPQFWEKDTFSRLHEGRSWGGGWGGVEMEGRMGGRLLAYMVGRWGGVPIASKAFFNSKIAIF